MSLQARVEAPILPADAGASTHRQTGGLAGRSATTVKKNRNVLEPILGVIGNRKLRQLSADEMRQALATMAAQYSSAVVSMGHLALTRAIRHAEASDLVGRNVAALVDTPKGQPGGRHDR